MADDQNQSDGLSWDSNDSFFGNLANWAHKINSVRDPDVMHENIYNFYRQHGFEPEQAAAHAESATNHAQSTMNRTAGIANAATYLHPFTGPARVMNDVVSAEGDPAKLISATPIGGLAELAATGAEKAGSSMGYASGGDVEKALGVAGQQPINPIQTAKQVAAAPRAALLKGQQGLMNTFQQENRPAAVVSPKPGTGSTDDSPGWSFATPDVEGADQPPPMQAPTQGKPRLANISNHAQKLMKSKGFRDLVRDHVGLHSLDVSPTIGSWMGEVEPSFIINGAGPNGEEMTHEQARKLSHMLGFGFQQDAVVTSHHNPNFEDHNIPTMYIGKGGKLSQSELDAVHSAAREHNLDFTRSKDGRGVKFSHFGDEAENPEFISKVHNVANKVGLPDRLLVNTKGDFNYAKDYLNEIFQGSGGENGLQTGSARSPDLFGRIVDHVLAPYAKGAASEGYRLSPERLGKLYGLTKDEVNKVRSSLYSKDKDDISSVPLMEDEEKLDVRPSGAHGKPVVDDVINALQNRAAYKGQVSPDDFSDTAKDRLSDAIAKEVGYHVKNSTKSAIGWYDNALKKAKGEYHQIFPELAKDPQKEQLFNSILGITSQGADVHTNSKNAARIYDMVRNGSTISDAVDALKGTFGKETRAIEFNLKKYESLADKLGPEQMQDLFNRKMPKKDWDKFIRENDFMVDHNGNELSTTGGANQKITGWSVFGPKIGSFMNNLNGDYSTLTADLWFTRTWNRLMGHSFLHQPSQEAHQYREFRDALRAEYHQKNGVEVPEGSDPVSEFKTQNGKVKLDPKTKQPVPWLHGNDTKDLSPEEYQKTLDNPDDMLGLAQKVHDRYWRSGYKDKSDLRRRAKNWVENRYNPAAAPRGAKERNFQQETVEKAQDTLKKKYGMDVSIADIQAALWFHEKEMFGKYGVASTRAEPADYYDAAKNTVAQHKEGTLFQNLHADKLASKMAAKAAAEEEDEEDHKAYGGAVDGYKDGGKVSYKLKPDDDDRKHAGYKDDGGKMTWMSPDKFLDQTQEIQMDEDDKKSIDRFENKIEKGKKLNPLAIYPSGGQDGRHRATAAKREGITKVPVIQWPKKANGGVVDRALQIVAKRK